MQKYVEFFFYDLLNGIYRNLKHIFIFKNEFKRKEQIFKINIIKSVNLKNIFPIDFPG